MIRFSANLSMLYPELQFLDRFAAARSDGFEAVEFLFPYSHAVAEIKKRLDDNGLTLALFNAPPGDWDAGERGVAALRGRHQEFDAGITRALEYANALDCARIHVMAGVVPDSHRNAAWSVYVESLSRACEMADGTGVMLLLEPLNLRDNPGYLLSSQEEAHSIVRRFNPTALGVQLDLYHCQITEGDLTATLQRDLPTRRVGHLQIAGVPRRQEPCEGEVDFAYLLQRIDDLHYEGFVGLEYRPAADTSQGVQRFVRHLQERGVHS